MKKPTDQHAEKKEFKKLIARLLPLSLKNHICLAAAWAVFIDLHLISFTDNKEGMTNFATAAFRAEQGTPVDDFIDPSTILSSPKSVSKGVTEFYDLKISNFRQFFLKAIVQFGGGALTTDGATPKVQDRQFYYLTAHCILIREFGKIDVAVQISMHCMTLLLKEKPEDGDAGSIRAILNSKRVEKYGVSLSELSKTCTMVTD